MSNTTNDNESTALITAAFIISGALGVGLFLCMPVVGPALVDGLGLSQKQVGEFSFIQLGFISIGCVLGMFVTRYFTMRLVACVCLLLLLAMDVISPQITDYSTLLMVRAAAGVFGGIVMALATGALAQLPAVERNFGLFLFTQIVLGMILIWAVPQLYNNFGMRGVYYPLVLLEIIAITFAFLYIPAKVFGSSNQQAQVGNSKLAWVCSGVSLLAMLSFFTAIGCYWTYVGIIGGNSGLSVESVGKGLSIATLGGITGALLPTFLQQRAGKLIPLLCAAGALLLALYLTSTHSDFISFVIAAGLFSFGWYSFHPYQMDVLASVDTDGRPTMASAALVGLGLGFGPVVVSRLVEDGLSVVYVVSAIGVIAALLMLFSVVVLAPKVAAAREAG